MRLPARRRTTTEKPQAGQTEASAEATPEPSIQKTAAPWQAFARERWQQLSAAALLAAGVVFVLLGWYGAAKTNIFTEQIPYLISGGLLGLGLIIVAGFLAYSSGIERELRELRRDLAQALNGSRPAATAGGAPATPADGRVFTVPGGRSFHEAGCPIIEGKEGVRAFDPGEAARAGLAACKLCGPG